MIKYWEKAISAVLSLTLLFGFPGTVAATSAPRAAETKLIAAGIPFGIRFKTAGVIVVGICAGCGPAADAGIRRGDVIVAIDGKELHSAAELSDAVRRSEGKPLTLEFDQGGVRRTATVTPITDEAGEARLGIWIKDSAAGIGTVTFIRPETLEFAGLGHGICDAETGTLVPFAYGNAEDVALSGILSGKQGAPGELRGSFSGKKTGKLLKNTPAGIYGILYELPTGLENALYPVADRDEVHEGKAELYTTVDGSGRQRYEVEIKAIDRDSEGRNFVVHVTDPALIEKTGGIVQGMSGSPLIQDGKFIGAVTHVLISDPTEGYGIFLETMLRSASIADSPSLPQAA